MTPWKPFRYRLEEAVCAALARWIPRLSRRHAVRMGQLLGTLAYRFDARGRAVAAANLECVYRGALSEAEIARLTSASYRNFARTMVDLFWGRRLNAENYRDWIRAEGVEELHARLAASGKGAVGICIHQGNWEWAGLLGGLIGIPLTTVAENFKNPRLDTIFARMRETTGQTMIPQENALLKMLRAVRRRGVTAMLIDLNLRPTQAATVVKAFGEAHLEMCVPLLHAVLAQRAGALLVPIETRSFDDGTCLVHIHPALEVPAAATVPEIAQLCWDFWEKRVLARPEDWLWPYKHFRYRPAGATGYPPYAHESKKFDKLRRETALAAARKSSAAAA